MFYIFICLSVQFCIIVAVEHHSLAFLCYDPHQCAYFSQADVIAVVYALNDDETIRRASNLLYNI